MNITAQMIADFRKRTGLPMMECKKALIETGGDEEKAIEFLRKRGITKAAEKSERTTKSGLVESYVHGGKIGVLVEVLSETDFVAKNDEFKSFVHDVALHIAAANPKYLSKDDVPKEEVLEERKILEDQLAAEKKPAEIVQKIIDGKLEKFYSKICLLNQPFVKDQEMTVGGLLTSKVAKIGENIVISRFCRFEIGR